MMTMGVAMAQPYLKKKKKKSEWLSKRKET